MTEQLEITFGCPPWIPATDATLVETLDRYDTPTSVLIGQNDLHFLGQALAGTFGTRAIWAYAPVDQDDLALIAQSAGPADVDTVVDRLLRGSVVSVLAVDDRIVFAHEVEIGPHDGRTEIVERIVGSVTAALRGLVPESEPVGGPDPN